MSDANAKPGPESEDLFFQLGLLTREGLAQALKVSVPTVDRMLADGDITPIRLRGKLVRFYLPNVVRELTAKAVTSKRGCARRLGEPLKDGKDAKGPKGPNCGWTRI